SSLELPSAHTGPGRAPAAGAATDDLAGRAACAFATGRARSRDSRVEDSAFGFGAGSSVASVIRAAGAGAPGVDVSVEASGGRLGAGAWRTGEASGAAAGSVQRWIP